VLRVDHENAHDDEGQGPRDHVTPDLGPRLAAAPAPAQGEGDRDPDDEEEGREDEVGDGHAVGVRGLVEQERRAGPRQLLTKSMRARRRQQVDRQDAGRAEGGGGARSAHGGDLPEQRQA
jgi:hypothetical protein